jgi:cell division protease FtsH
MRNLAYLFGIILFCVIIYSQFGTTTRNKVESVSISQITREVTNNNVEKVTVENNSVEAKLKDGRTLKAQKEPGVGINEYGITPDKVQLSVDNKALAAFWLNMLQLILPVLLLGGFIYLMYRNAQGGNMKAISFAKTTARVVSGPKKVTFQDVAGLQNAKQELQEVVEFLKTPEKFHKLGAEIPKGVLLIGPAGVGKTLLAKAVAGEAGVPFFTLSASEFVEMFVGVGAARVRDLFAKAKKVAPVVIFIDELDAIGRQRGTGMGGSHDEREQTLNQILVEMDGFETDSRVIILAATNRPDVLDPALMRPGRFDRKVMLDLPDRQEREDILKVHIRNKPVAKGVDLHIVSRQTPGASGSDLKNIVNEAAILAARDNKKDINQYYFTMAIEKVMIGPERKSHLMNEHERRVAAYHESGHALVGKAVPQGDPIHKISLVSRGFALGFTWSLPEEDRTMHSKSRFEDEIASLLAGRAAEELIFNEVTTGAANDFERATHIARDMVTMYGMSSLGPVTWGERQDNLLGRGMEVRNYSEKQAELIDDAVKVILSKQMDRAKQILQNKMSLLEQVAERLLKEETIEGDDFNIMYAEFHGETIEKPKRTKTNGRRRINRVAKPAEV